jgi:hypothetical protein
MARPGEGDRHVRAPAASGRTEINCRIWAS